VLTALAGSANLETNGVWVWMSAFAERLRVAGLSVEVTTNSALGGEADRTELTSLGLLHVNDAGSTELAAYSGAYVAVELPFLFDDTDHFTRFIDAPEFRAWLDADLKAPQLVFADAALLGGMSGLFTANAPVRQISDLAHMRLRAMGRRDLLVIDALGASGVQVAWEEVPQALQTGIAQGYFNPPLAPVMFGHGSQINYFADLGLSASHRPITLSRRWLEGLSPHMRDAVDDAIAAGRAANHAWAHEGRSRDAEALAAIGVEIFVPPEPVRRVFVERAVGAYPSMGAPDVIARAVALAARTRR